MTISFARSPWCGRCRKYCGNEPKAFMQISPRTGRLAWLTLRFRVCNPCWEQMAEKMERLAQQ